MLRDESSEVIENEGAWAHQTTRTEDWREVDRGLCRNAKRRCELDAEEAELLRAAYRVRIWREVGASSMIEYMEMRLGYAPRTAQERLRVALALGELPGLSAALATSEHPFTAIRELVRVVTPEIEGEWLDQVRGMTVHEVQQEVSGHRKGSRPGDMRDPDLRLRTCRFDEVRPSTIALDRQARAMAQQERGERLSDDEFLAMMYGAYLAGASTAKTAKSAESAETAEISGRARFQVAVTICERCEQGWQEGGGRKFAMDASEVARAKCDAQHIGSLDASEPARATQDVSPRVRRFVHRRDGGKCSLPWCRSSSHLELHHIIPREHGGSHQALNIIQLCDSHHAALHRGLITITGRAPDQLVVTGKHRPGAHVGASDKPTREASARVGASDKTTRESDARVGASDNTTRVSGARVGASDNTTREPGARVGASDNTTREPGARVGASSNTTREPSTRVSASDNTTREPAARVGARDNTTREPSTRVGASGNTTREPSTRVGASDNTTREPAARVGARDKVTREASARVGVSDRLARATMLVEARTALVTLGFKRHEAAVAVDAASARVGAQVSLELLIREALKQCARTTS